MKQRQEKIVTRRIKNATQGFTLVEMMVSIAIFSIVMVTAMSALLNVIDANNKARSIKTVINNIGFALEGISKDMRVGTNYTCSVDGFSFTGDGNCSTGGIMVKYKSPRSDSNGFAYYKLIGTQLTECLETGSKLCNNDDDFSPITSAELTIKQATFYVLGVSDPTLQPRVVIILSGEAGSKEKTRTTFDLQTSVSERTRNEVRIN